MATETEREAFLARWGWGAAAHQPLMGDASSRRYTRLRRGSPAATCLLAETANPEADIHRFSDMSERLARHGFAAPRILATDAGCGLILLEDWGDNTIRRVQAAIPERSWDLECRMVDVLIALRQRLGPESLAGWMRYTGATLVEQAGLFLETAFPVALGEPAAPAVRAAFAEAWRAALEPALAPIPTGFLHRDFHADNLMLIPGRSGLAEMGLLDFQDAGLGPVLYDLVSLVEDARRSLRPGQADALIARYRAAFPECDDGVFAAGFQALAAQRHVRVVAVFTRLVREVGRTAYAAHLPRVALHLRRHLEAPVLAPVAAWFARFFPPEAFFRLVARVCASSRSLCLPVTVNTS